MIPPPPSLFLDQARSWGVSGCHYTFVAEDVSGPKLDLHPLRPPTIRVDTSAAIIRTLSGFEIAAFERSQIDPLSDRVRVAMVTPDGREWPLGLFYFASGAGSGESINATFSGSLYDGGIQFDNEMSFAYGLPPHARVTDSLTWLLTYVAGIADAQVEPSEQTAGTPLNWAPGTLLRQILDDLCELASYTRAYFDAEGTCRAHRYPPMELGRCHVYAGGADSRVLEANQIETAIEAPGRHVVLGTGPSNGPIVGVATVPFSSPLHPDRRRFTRTKVHRTQGALDFNHAQSMAQNYADGDPADYRIMEITTPPDPRHDIYEVVEYLDEPWRETTWTLQLTPKGPHTHRLAKGVAS